MATKEEIKYSPEVFENLIISQQSKLYKTGMAILKNDDDTCDAIQETLMSAYKNFKSLKNIEYFGTWITRILINKCYDIIRNNKKVSYINKEMEVDSNTSYYDIYKSESVVERTLDLLDTDLRLVAILYYYDENSVKEISELLNIPEGTVKSRLSRARDKMYDILKKEEGDSIG